MQFKSKFKTKNNEKKMIAKLRFPEKARHDKWCFEEVKGVLHHLPQKAPKLACFVLYMFLNFINIFFEK